MNPVLFSMNCSSYLASDGVKHPINMIGRAYLLVVMILLMSLQSVLAEENDGQACARETR